MRATSGLTGEPSRLQNTQARAQIGRRVGKKNVAVGAACDRVHHNVGVVAPRGGKHQTIRVAFVRGADNVGGTAVGQHAVGDDEVDGPLDQIRQSLTFAGDGTDNIQGLVAGEFKHMPLAPIRLGLHDEHGSSRRSGGCV